MLSPTKLIGPDRQSLAFRQVCRRRNVAQTFARPDFWVSYRIVFHDRWIRVGRPDMFGLSVLRQPKCDRAPSKTQPDQADQFYGIVCAHLYDAQRLTNFSFSHEPNNVAEISTATAPNLSIWGKLIRPGRFYVGSMSQRDFRGAADRLRPSRHF